MKYRRASAKQFNPNHLNSWIHSRCALAAIKYNLDKHKCSGHEVSVTPSYSLDIQLYDNILEKHIWKSKYNLTHNLSKTFSLLYQFSNL